MQLGAGACCSRCGLHSFVAYLWVLSDFFWRYFRRKQLHCTLKEKRTEKKKRAPFQKKHFLIRELQRARLFEAGNVKSSSALSSDLSQARADRVILELPKLCESPESQVAHESRRVANLSIQTKSSHILFFAFFGFDPVILTF